MICSTWSSARKTICSWPRSTSPARASAKRPRTRPRRRPRATSRPGAPLPEPAGALAHAGDAAVLGDVLAQGGGRGRGQEACRDRLLGHAFRAGGDAVGAGAATGGHGRGPAVPLPEQAGVVVEPVPRRHAVADRLEIGRAALGLIVVVDAEAAAEETEAGGGG